MSESASGEFKHPRKRPRHSSGDSSHSSLRRSPRTPQPKKAYNDVVDDWIHENQKMEKITEKHAMCMYSENKSYPSWMMPGGPSSKLYFVDSLHGTCIRKIDKKMLDLNTKQTDTYNCLVECVEATFSGLIYHNADNVWHDEKGKKERFQECVNITKKYGVLEQFAVDLFDVYHAFKFGFYNSLARNAMQSLCSICILVLGMPVLEHTFNSRNIGGSSPRSDGSCRVVRFYSEKSSKKTEEEILKTFNVQEVEATRCRTYVPDFVLVKWKDDNEETGQYVLFGECKSSDCNEEMLSQLWHQTLNGLFQGDTSYGCGAKASSFVFMKLDKTCPNKSKQCRLKSYLEKFDFVESDDNSDNQFNTSEFCDAIQLMLKIIQKTTNG